MLFRSLARVDQLRGDRLGQSIDLAQAKAEGIAVIEPVEIGVRILLTRRHEGTKRGIRDRSQRRRGAERCSARGEATL